MWRAGRIFCRVYTLPRPHQWHAPDLRTRRLSRARAFHFTAARNVVKPFILADIGEGIKEVQIIQWFVKPGARVEQFDKLCEVASDKAIVEITSRFDGVIKELHYEPEAMAQVGKPLCDIDIQGEISAKDAELLEPTKDDAASSASPEPSKTTESEDVKDGRVVEQPPPSATPTSDSSSEASKLATPAIRGLLKELDIKIEDVQGTGKDGRVLKEDVHKHAGSRAQPPSNRHNEALHDAVQHEKEVPLTPVQAAMFRTMTQSISIPHFLFTDDVDLTELHALRDRLNTSLPTDSTKLTYLPFILKALSLALQSYPLLNARLNPSSNQSSPPTLTYRAHHNIGIAIDTSQGLLVPTIKDAASQTVASLTSALAELSSRAHANTLSPTHLSGGTITVSNVGALGGGTVVAPVLVPGQVAILGVGRAREVPRFDEAGQVVKRRVASFSWSADHRVVDGATVARAAGKVRELLEEPGRMVVEMR